MPVMDVGVMRMRVRHPRMVVGMAMRFAGGITDGVTVLMMLIVHVSMRVLHFLVYVYVLVPFADVKPYTNAHTGRSDPE